VGYRGREEVPWTRRRTLWARTSTPEDQGDGRTSSETVLKDISLWAWHEILTDEQWERVHPLLPARIPKTGRPAKDLRATLEAILRIAPERPGATRFHRWVEARGWNHVLAELQMEADAQGELDWTPHHVDGTSRR